ncbi:hypothetical protein TrLO_g8593 [Triparma laevis f. longispina]|uniref:Uncharacterized protein n=1 Tax=Triparma laevis f. longispina TaxID=1714387 RepID=A0A9W7ATF9_9STRA|nr:hypothetical protein TrLO_g8593 [Triparma laevis f. longispina]
MSTPPQTFHTLLPFALSYTESQYSIQNKSSAMFLEVTRYKLKSPASSISSLPPINSPSGLVQLSTMNGKFELSDVQDSKYGEWLNSIVRTANIVNNFNNVKFKVVNKDNETLELYDDNNNNNNNNEELSKENEKKKE